VLQPGFLVESGYLESVRKELSSEVPLTAAAVEDPGWWRRQ